MVKRGSEERRVRGGMGLALVRCTGPSAAFRASCVCVRVTCVCVKCVWAASMSAVGCPVARLVSGASVSEPLPENPP